MWSTLENIMQTASGVLRNSRGVIGGTSINKILEVIFKKVHVLKAVAVGQCIMGVLLISIQHVDGDGGYTLRDTTRVGSRLVCGIVLVCW